MKVKGLGLELRGFQETRTLRIQAMLRSCDDLVNVGTASKLEMSVVYQNDDGSH